MTEKSAFECLSAIPGWITLENRSVIYHINTSNIALAEERNEKVRLYFKGGTEFNFEQEKPGEFRRQLLLSQPVFRGE